MNADIVVDIIRSALWIILKTSAPMLLVSLVVGLVISVFQTVTSIQEQTLTFVPKIVAIFLVLILCGSWIFTTINDFAVNLFSSFQTYIR